MQAHLKRQAKNALDFYVPPATKLLCGIRIRDINRMPPKSQEDPTHTFPFLSLSLHPPSLALSLSCRVLSLTALLGLDSLGVQFLNNLKG
jgi:hypothetical protein